LQFSQELALVVVQPPLSGELILQETELRGQGHRGRAKRMSSTTYSGTLRQTSVF